jgi:hypothetical protein
MDATTQRVLGIGALAGGLLRVGNAFTAGTLSPQALQMPYALTDILLLIGLAGILLRWRVELQRLGFAGVAITAIGLTIIRATGFSSLAMQGYMIGAAVSVIGVALLGADMIWRRAGSRIAPYLWLASFTLAMWSAFGGQATLQALAGIAFGAGFVVAGIDLLADTRHAAAPGT